MVQHGTTAPTAFTPLCRPRRSLFFLPVLDPLGKAVFIWVTITTLVDLSYTAFIVPLSLAFQPPMLIGGDHFMFVMVFDFIGSKLRRAS